MAARFPCMIGVMNNSVKCGLQYCEVPANKICINTLRLLRNQGFIWGFSFTSPGKRQARLYPRVKIYFKYINKDMPGIKAIYIYKKTRSNFTILRHNKLLRILAQNKLYLLTTPSGLTITSITNYYNSAKKSVNSHTSGIILAEILI